MDLGKSVAWIVFAVIVGVTGIGRGTSAKPADKPSDTRSVRTQVAQREPVKVAGPVTDRARPMPMVRTSAP